MDSLREIILQISDTSIRLSDILRKAKILAYQLRSEELKTWVDSELNGYDSSRPESIPDYRTLSTQSYGTFVGPFGTSASRLPIPTVNLPKEVGEFATEITLYDGIRSLESMADEKRPSFDLAWPPDLVAACAPHIYNNARCVVAWRVVSKAQVEQILDAVKNRLLSFVLELDSILPQEDDSTERQLTVPIERVSQLVNSFIIKGGTNVFAIGHDVSQNAIQVAKGDINGLAGSLGSIGIPETDIAELQEAIGNDGNRTKEEGFGRRVTEWLGKATMKIGTGACKVALEVAPVLITKAIAQYYGWDKP